VGATTNLAQRIADHVAGTACRTTALDPPVRLVHWESCTDFPAARHREAQVKRWTAAKKEALVARDLARLRLLSRRHGDSP
jgi:predicted GIY-YIG superfamily endonuclease